MARTRPTAPAVDPGPAAPQIEWRSPPPPQPRKRGFWRAHLAPLVERPGEWACVYTCASHAAAIEMVSRLRNRRTVSIPAGSWEFDHHGPEVFALYRGEGR